MKIEDIVLISDGYKSKKMKQNTKVFEGLFDKFGDNPVCCDDILAPIKRELARFLTSRQKSRGVNKTCLASDYGMPIVVWEKNGANLRDLEQTITDRIQQLDPRCQNVACHLSLDDGVIDLSISLSVISPRQREPHIFAMSLPIKS